MTCVEQCSCVCVGECAYVIFGPAKDRFKASKRRRMRTSTINVLCSKAENRKNAKRFLSQDTPGEKKRRGQKRSRKGDGGRLYALLFGLLYSPLVLSVLPYLVDP